MTCNAELTAAILVSGGITGGYTTAEVEVLSSGGGAWCSLPALPAPRSHHTQSGLLACGGGYEGANISTSCSALVAGAWQPSHLLAQPRCPAPRLSPAHC